MSTPTNVEQQILEMINRARLNPSGEFNNLILNTNPVTGVTAGVTTALKFFNVDLNLFRQ